MVYPCCIQSCTSDQVLASPRRIWRYQKWQSESVNRRTDKIIVKRKRTKGQTTQFSSTMLTLKYLMHICQFWDPGKMYSSKCCMENIRKVLTIYNFRSKRILVYEIHMYAYISHGIIYSIEHRQYHAILVTSRFLWDYMQNWILWYHFETPSDQTEHLLKRLMIPRE